MDLSNLKCTALVCCQKFISFPSTFMFLVEHLCKSWQKSSSCGCLSHTVNNLFATSTTNSDEFSYSFLPVNNVVKRIVIGFLYNSNIQSIHCYVFFLSSYFLLLKPYIHYVWFEKQKYYSSVKYRQGLIAHFRIIKRILAIIQLHLTWFDLLCLLLRS